jgi:hypothetical protein
MVISFAFVLLRRTNQGCGWFRSDARKIPRAPWNLALNTPHATRETGWQGRSPSTATRPCVPGEPMTHPCRTSGAGVRGSRTRYARRSGGDTPGRADFSGRMGTRFGQPPPTERRERPAVSHHRAVAAYGRPATAPHAAYGRPVTASRSAYRCSVRARRQAGRRSGQSTASRLPPFGYRPATGWHNEVRPRPLTPPTQRIHDAPCTDLRRRTRWRARTPVRESVALYQP